MAQAALPCSTGSSKMARISAGGCPRRCNLRDDLDCRRPAVPKRKRACGSAPATAAKMRFQTASWTAISVTGRRGASLNAIRAK
jgi:hypothetical protein